MRWDGQRHFYDASCAETEARAPGERLWVRWVEKPDIRGLEMFYMLTFERNGAKGQGGDGGMRGMVRH